MLNFYRRFLPQAAVVEAPLHALIGGPKQKGSQPITWTPTLLKAFESSKASLSDATMLAHPDCSAPIAVVTDASATDVGAVLEQRENNDWRPLAFFSRKMSAAQQKILRV
jgi:hypothetical protein